MPYTTIASSNSDLTQTQEQPNTTSMKKSEPFQSRSAQAECCSPTTRRVAQIALGILGVLLLVGGSAALIVAAGPGFGGAVAWAGFLWLWPIGWYSSAAAFCGMICLGDEECRIAR